MKCLLDAYPDGAKAMDKNGLLPLQIAAQDQAKDEVVAELLTVYPGGARVKDKHGRYPVRIAFENAYRAHEASRTSPSRDRVGL